MWNLGLILLAAIACQQLTSTHALYFHIRETERKCFIEEVPDETLVVGMLLMMMMMIVF